jgi:uncharacterized Ntn-hydrolase superfamily protein
VELRSSPWARGPRAWSVAALSALAGVWACVGLAGTAAATWSIVAVDPDSGLVGAAIASCVPASVLGDPGQTLVPVVLVPGRGAGVSQGTIDPEAPPRLRSLLADGATASEVIDTLLADDEQASVRQYGAVTLGGGPGDDGPGPTADVFTGDDVEDETAAAIGDVVSVQGGLLVDRDLADRALDAYVAARQAGRSLDRALADALVAGSRAGGDRRCDEQTALFAHLAVAEPDDDGLRPSLLLTVTVDEGDGQNPVVLLDRALDDGRVGWVDAGRDEPAGVSRTLVFGIGVALTVAAVMVIRRGMGSPAGRRRSPGL